MELFETPVTRAWVMEMIQSTVKQMIPEIHRELAINMVGRKVNTRLTVAEKNARQAGRREDAMKRGVSGCEQFKSARMVPEFGATYPQRRAYEQYSAWSLANQMTPIGPTKFGQWLDDQGFGKFMVETVAGRRPHRNGFTVTADPAIDPHDFSARELDTSDLDFVSVAKAGRSARLKRPSIQRMVNDGVVEWSRPDKKRMLVSLSDVLANAEAYRPPPYKVPVIGCPDQWLDERTYYKHLNRMPHDAAILDYRAWCDKRGEKPLTIQKFKSSLGDRHHGGKTGKNETRQYTYHNVALKDEPI